MKKMTVKSEIANAIVAEMERAREIYEIMANKDESEAWKIYKQTVRSINAKYDVKES